MLPGRPALRPYAVFVIAWRSVQLTGIAMSFPKEIGALSVTLDVSFMAIQGIGECLYALRDWAGRERRYLHTRDVPQVL